MKTAPPVQCSEPNRPDIEFITFDVQNDVVVADLAALLKDYQHRYQPGEDRRRVHVEPGG